MERPPLPPDGVATFGLAYDPASEAPRRGARHLAPFARDNIPTELVVTSTPPPWTTAPPGAAAPPGRLDHRPPLVGSVVRERLDDEAESRP